MLLACVAALVLRANLPAAVLATFVSNPLTTPAILLAGYHLGRGWCWASRRPP
jgi:uncharacterized protein (DUF2062 family)